MAVAAQTILAQLVTAAGPRGQDALSLLLKILGNIAEQPAELKFRRLKLDSQKLQQDLLCHPGALQLLESIGFVRAADGAYELPPGAEAAAAFKDARAAAQRHAAQQAPMDAASHVAELYRQAVEGGAHGAGHAELQAILQTPGGHEALEILEKVITNIRRHMESEKYRCISLAKAAGQKVLPALPLMALAGFERRPLPTGEDAIQLVRVNIDVLERIWAMVWWATRRSALPPSLGAFQGPAARALAALLGAAVGDALGGPLGGIGPFEVSAAEVDKAMEMCGGGIWGVAPGQATANTELATCLTQSLAEAPEPLGDSLLEDLAVRYGRWGKSLPFHSERACAQAFVKPLAAADMALRAKELSSKSTGCGALVRCPPLAVWAVIRGDVAAAASFARQDATLSHPNPVLGQASAACVVLMARLAASGDRATAIAETKAWVEEERGRIVARVGSHETKGWQHLSRGEQSRVSERVPGAQQEWAPPGESLAAIDELVGWLKRGLSDDAGELLTFQSTSAGHLLNHEVGSAEIPLVHALRHLKGGSSFETAMRATLAGGGDSSTNAAIVGGILGAAVGLEGIPERWIRAVLTCNTNDGQLRPPEYHPSTYLELLGQIQKKSN